MTYTNLAVPAFSVIYSRMYLAVYLRVPLTRGIMAPACEQAKLFIEFVGSQQEVALSQDILVPQDGYAGPGASLVDKQVSEQLELSPRP